VNGHEHTFRAGSIELVADDAFMRAQETRGPKPLSDRIWGIVFAAVFFGASLLFALMPVENADQVFWLRVILCGGLAMIGLILIVGAIGEKKISEFVEVHREKGLLISGRDTKAGRKVTNQMPLRAIENVYLGSEALNHASKTLGGTQTLYITGEGAPKKNILFVGSGTALNEIKFHIQRLAGN